MKVLTPIKAIRSKCIECCCSQRNEVRLCTIPDCPLFPYRMGHRPKNNIDEAEEEIEEQED